MRVRNAVLALCLTLFVIFFSADVVASVMRPKTLRVMTYNIHVGKGMDGKLDLKRIAAVINDVRPDLVGLQEVDRGVERTERVDQIAELARLTNMRYAFAHNLDYQGGQYGVAILSRLPIIAWEHRRYANLYEAERRGFLRIEIALGRQRIQFVTTHLDYQREDGRVFETKQLLEAIREAASPLIVVGDFNDEPAGAAYKLMRESFADAWSDKENAVNGATYPANKPIKRIDYVFFRSATEIKATNVRIIQTTASDHLPLIVELALSEQ